MGQVNVIESEKNNELCTVLWFITEAEIDFENCNKQSHIFADSR